MRILVFSVVAIAISAFANDRKPGEIVTARHRIAGLFWPDREADLREAIKQIPSVELISVDLKYGEAVFTYDPATAFKETKPEKILEKFNDRLRGITRETFSVWPLSTSPKDRLTLIEIPVIGLDCKGCCLAAYEAIFKIDGVVQATASFKEGRVTALIDPGKTNRSAVEEALKKRNVRLKS